MVSEIWSSALCNGWGRKITQIPPLNLKDRNYFIFGPSPPSIPRVSTYLCEFMPSHCTSNPGANLFIFVFCIFKKNLKIQNGRHFCQEKYLLKPGKPSLHRYSVGQKFCQNPTSKFLFYEGKGFQKVLIYDLVLLLLPPGTLCFRLGLFVCAFVNRITQKLIDRF